MIGIQLNKKENSLIENNKLKLNINNTNNKLMFVLLIFLFEIFFQGHSVLGSKELIYSGILYSDSPISIDSINYQIEMYNYSMSIESSDGTTLTVQSDDCNEKDNIQFCYNSFYDTSPDTSGDISIYRLLPSIDIDRTIEKNVLVLGEETEININIKNSGDYEAENFNLTDEYPDSIELEDAEGNCKIKNNKIVFFDDDFNIDEELECSITVKAIKTANIKLVGTYNYFDGNKYIEKNTGILDIDINSGLSIVITNDEELDIGDIGEYKLTITNDNNLDLTAEVSIIKPNNIFFEDDDNIITETINDSTVYLKSMEISSGDSEDITLDYKASRNGIGKIITLVKYYNNEENITGTDNKDNIIQVNVQDIEIKTNFVDDSEITESGQKILLDYSIENPNKDIDFRNISISFGSDLFFIEPQKIDKLASYQNEEILNRIFLIPNVEASQRYRFNLIVNYTLFGNELQKELDKQIIIKPQGTIIIRHTLDKRTIESGDLVNVKITAENTKNLDLDNVCINEDIGGDFIREGGISKVCFSIEKGETKELMEYQIRAIGVGTGTLRTNVTFDNYGVLESKIYEENYDVEPKEIDQELKVSSDIENEYFLGEIIDIPVEIKNDGDKTLLNINYTLKHIPEFDYIKDKVFIKKLDPGESIDLDKAFEVRAKKEGIFKFPDETITGIIYDNDVYNKLNTNKRINFSTDITGLTFKIKDNVLNEPAIILKRTARKVTLTNNNSVDYINHKDLKNSNNNSKDISYKNNESTYGVYGVSYNITYNIENLGLKGSGELIDDCFNVYKKFNLSDYQTKKITIIIKNITESKFCDEAKIVYNSGINLNTYSDELTIIYIKPKKEFNNSVKNISINKNVDYNNALNESENNTNKNVENNSSEIQILSGNDKDDNKNVNNKDNLNDKYNNLKKKSVFTAIKEWFLRLIGIMN